MPKHGTYGDHNTHTHTHTNKPYDTLNVQCTKRQQHTVVFARTNTKSAAQDCSPTVAQTLTARSSHRQSACTITVRHLDSGNAFEDMKFSFSTCLLWTLRNILHIIRCTYRNTLRSKWILRNIANTQLTLRHTVHRIFNRFCPILSTEHSIFLTLHKKSVAPD